MKKTIVITGIGGMGIACARRLGSGYKLLLCDFNEQQLSTVSAELTMGGYDVTTLKLDVSDKASVEAAASKAVELGEIQAIIHTAGLSPTMSSGERILNVNLIGTARMLEAFEPHLSPGTVGVFISSSSSYLSNNLTPEQEKEIIRLSADGLLEYIPTLGLTDPNAAYPASKKANRLQIAAASVKWGKKGARVMSISPGVHSTPMGKQEQEAHAVMSYMIDNTPAGRVGTAEDIAAMVEFIISPAGNFLSGSDILVDGGVVAFLQTSAGK
ncbi:SDR family oxidoreductase [Sphingobacterium siyangense subsp. cladoniae]|uniref:SDR family oxidoreductase n=1 Tax=Sphingobacterium siyangense TaxID=459529 RepID=UPI0031F9A185